jgi:(p)ppGpp synthase/HD superfamily hydrolase
MKPNWSQDKYIEAWDIATLAHQGQTYPGPIEGQRFDYINHIGSVTMELIWALTEDESLNGDLAVQCAILHDIIEDTKCTYQDLKAKFGSKVANGVNALTKNGSLPKNEQMDDSLERIKRQPKEIWMVKLADRITNMSQPPYHWGAEKRKVYKEQAQLILDQLGTANKLLATRLSERISMYSNYIDMAE